VSVKAERFRRVAAPRVQKVLDSLENLSKCANRSNYEYSEPEVQKMVRTIKAKLRNLESKFGNDPQKGPSNKFTF
jgi:hypothetical protein